jgi:hypothetical protein
MSAGAISDQDLQVIEGADLEPELLGLKQIGAEITEC